MTVYLPMKCVDYEGEDVVGVFSTRDKALGALSLAYLLVDTHGEEFTSGADAWAIDAWEVDGGVTRERICDFDALADLARSLRAPGGGQGGQP